MVLAAMAAAPAAGVAAVPGGIGVDRVAYTGAYVDASGLVHLGARHLRPEGQAFLEADVPAAGMLNAYVYAVGDPVNLTDPTGQSPIGDWLSRIDLSLGVQIGDIGLSVAGLAAAVAAVPTGGWSLAAVAAVAAGAAAVAASSVSLADEVHARVTGEGLLPEPARIAAQWGGVAGGAVGAIVGARSAIKIARAGGLKRLRSPVKSPDIAVGEPAGYDEVTRLRNLRLLAPPKLPKVEDGLDGLRAMVGSSRPDFVARAKGWPAYQKHIANWEEAYTDLLSGRDPLDVRLTPGPLQSGADGLDEVSSKLGILHVVDRMEQSVFVALPLKADRTFDSVESWRVWYASTSP